MPTLTQEIREQLLTYDPEFQKLTELHSQYEAQLRQLFATSLLPESGRPAAGSYPPKNLKLRVKDAMEQLTIKRSPACAIPLRAQPAGTPPI